MCVCLLKIIDQVCANHSGQYVTSRVKKQEQQYYYYNYSLMRVYIDVNNSPLPLRLKQPFFDHSRID